MRKMITMWSIISLFMLLVAGCGGGVAGDEDNNNNQNNLPPSISDRTPADGEVDVPVTTTIKITFSKAIGRVTTTNLELEDRDGNLVPIRVVRVLDDEVTYKPVNSLATNTTYKVTSLKVPDLNGNLSATESWTFTTTAVAGGGTLPPSTFKVVGFTPIADATDVQLDIQPQVTFSDNVDPASATSANVRMNNGAIVGAIVVNERVITFRPAVNLLVNKDYQWDVSGIKDLAGNIMSGTFTVNFSTGTSIGIFPLSDSIGVINGGASRALYDKVTGTANVKIAGQPFDVAIKWTPVVVKIGVANTVSFACNPLPANLKFQVELKDDTAPFTSYAVKSATCSGGVVTVDLPAALASDATGRLAINLGENAGLYTIGPVTFSR